MPYKVQRKAQNPFFIYYFCCSDERKSLHLFDWERRGDGFSKSLVRLDLVFASRLTVFTCRDELTDWSEHCETFLSYRLRSIEQASLRIRNHAARRDSYRCWPVDWRPQLLHAEADLRDQRSQGRVHYSASQEVSRPTASWSRCRWRSGVRWRVQAYLSSLKCFATLPLRLT